MRNKKTFVGLFVILALLCLGIGYATMSKTLTINGGVETGDVEDLADSNFIIYFSKVEVDTSLAEGATVTANVDAAAKSISTTFKIENMNKVGSKVVLTYTVNNDSEDLYANSPTILFSGDVLDGEEINAGDGIGLGTIPLNDPYFTITITPNNMVNGQAAPKSTHTITIVIEMTNTPLVKQTHDFSFKLVYGATDMEYTS